MKKNQTLLVIAAITSFLSACTKSDSTHPDGSIVGSWKEVKLHVSQTSNGVTKDTTLNADALSSADRAVFSGDTTAVFTSGSNIPYPGAPVTLEIREIRYNYQLSGSVLTLMRKDVPPGQQGSTPAIKTETIIQLDSKSLALHDSYTNGGDKISTDSYFARE